MNDADWQIHHGVFLEVAGLGVLITGPSGIGKGNLALQLIDRGARLIADDAPEFQRRGEGLTGRCPPLLRDYLEVRPLGVLDIRAMYGEEALGDEATLGLIIELQAQTQAPERLNPEHSTRELLGLELPFIGLSGNNLALLVEAAARRQVLYYNGHDFTRTFIERQGRQLQNPSE